MCWRTTKVKVKIYDSNMFTLILLSFALLHLVDTSSQTASMYTLPIKTGVKVYTDYIMYENNNELTSIFLAAII